MKKERNNLYPEERQPDRIKESYPVNLRPMNMAEVIPRQTPKKLLKNNEAGEDNLKATYWG